MSPAAFNQPKPGASPDSRLSTSNHKSNFSLPSTHTHHPLHSLPQSSLSWFQAPLASIYNYQHPLTPF
ncbi:hypothetical protein N7456_003980 [Penicillium angulare]|uniref:Uncharacterized protein n=1 Tax=Penicillium angulare TaxID=116970 RepID=A0A9W9FVM7_9EURO|nr:hypothetical protein N7456_003980 [Penicillium angulare]